MSPSSQSKLARFLGAALLAACAGVGDGPGKGSGGGVASGGTMGSGGISAAGGTASGGAVGGSSTAGSGSGGNGLGQGSGGMNGSGGAAGASAGGGGASGGSAGNGGRTSGYGGMSTGGNPAGGTTRTGSGGAAATGGVTGAGGGSAADGGTTDGSGSAHTGKWRIMPLGDSITETTCYPKLLAQELISKGHTNFEFVGTSLNNQGCGTAPNVQTEGHGCYLVTNLQKDVSTVTGCNGTKGSLAELRSWASEKPDVVLMEYGTNDAWSSIATQSILDAYTLVVDQFRGQNPNVIFFVAQITPLNPSGCGTCEANVEALNAKIPSWASDKNTAASPVYVVNVWSSLPWASYTPSSTYTSDGCHPNQAGSQLMADKWYEGVTAHGIP